MRTEAQTHAIQPHKFARYYRLRQMICVFCGKLAWCRIKRPDKRYPSHVPMLVCAECAKKR